MSNNEPSYWGVNLYRTDYGGQPTQSVHYIVRTSPSIVEVDLNAPDSVLREYFRHNLPDEDVVEFAKKDHIGIQLMLGYRCAQIDFEQAEHQFLPVKAPEAYGLGSEVTDLGPPVTTNHGVFLWRLADNDKRKTW